MYALLSDLPLLHATESARCSLTDRSSNANAPMTGALSVSLVLSIETLNPTALRKSLFRIG